MPGYLIPSFAVSRFHSSEAALRGYLKNQLEFEMDLCRFLLGWSESCWIDAPREKTPTTDPFVRNGILLKHLYPSLIVASHHREPDKAARAPNAR